MNQKKFIVILFIVGLLVRLSVAILPGFQIDMNDWYAWALRLSQFNYSQFYSKDIFTDYTPGYLYILSFLGFLNNLLGLTAPSFYLLLKLPGITAELLISLLIYKFLKKKISQKITLITLLLILFNPTLIFNSSVWGQIDSVLTLLMLFSIVKLSDNQLVISSIFFGLALLVKPQAIALLPVFVLYLINYFNAANLLKALIPSIFVVLLLAFPFFPNQTLINLIKHVLNTANEYPYNSVNAFNLWGIIGFWIEDSQKFLNFSLKNWGYFLFALYNLILFFSHLKRRMSPFILASLFTLGFYFLPTRVHERYLYPALIFLFIIAGLLRSRLIFIFTSLLSFIHLLNLYKVYIYYNLFYSQLPSLLYQMQLYNFIDLNSTLLSLISSLLFVLIAIGIINRGAIDSWKIKFYGASKKN